MGSDKELHLYGVGRQVETDVARYRYHVRKAIGNPNTLRKIVGDPGLIGRQGKDLVSIPVPQLENPQFRFGQGQGGVGQGDGSGEGGKAGDQPGDHILEVELSLQEIVKLFPIKKRKLLPLTGEEVKEHWKMHGITRNRTVKRSFRRSYKEGLSVEAAIAGLQERAIDPRRAVGYIDWRGVARYHGWEVLPSPYTDLTIILIADASGSMTQEKKDLMRQFAFWIQKTMEAYYKSVLVRFIVHDVTAHEVDQSTFYSIHESGGTKVSSGLSLANGMMAGLEMVKAMADDELYYFLKSKGRSRLSNYMVLDFTDGENFGREDNNLCVQILNEMFQNPLLRFFGYTEIQPGHDHDLKMAIMNGTDETAKRYGDDRFGVATINNFDDVYGAIVGLLG